MRVVFALDWRCDRTPDGAVWTKGSCPYEHWTYLLDIYDSVSLIVRVRDVPSVPADMQRLNGDGVSIAPIPYYVGPWQYLFCARQARKAAEKAVQIGDAVIVQGGRSTATIENLLHSKGYPFALRVIGDPYDTFAPGAMKHPLRPYFRWSSPRGLQKLCDEASAVLYVTQHTLQRRYPCSCFSVGVTDVDLPDSAFVSKPRLFDHDKQPITIAMVGTLAQLYKAPDVLIDAVGSCIHQGLALKLLMIGDGKHRPELEARTAKLGISEHVHFLGQLPSGNAVFEQLDQADIFALPSHQEGLPRAMMEAMARALPCIGSTAGGIPELLPAEDMVPPGDAKALANKIAEIATDPERLTRMSSRNLNIAKEYRHEALRERQMQFYGYVKDKTKEWLDNHDDKILTRI